MKVICIQPIENVLILNQIYDVLYENEFCYFIEGNKYLKYRFALIDKKRGEKK